MESNCRHRGPTETATSANCDTENSDVLKWQRDHRKVTKSATFLKPKRL